MAAFAYEDWDAQTGAAAQLARLLLHLQEVRQALKEPGIGAHGYNRTPAQLERYYQSLLDERNALQRAAGPGGGQTLATFPKR